jgi:hypothetical protein
MSCDNKDVKECILCKECNAIGTPQGSIAVAEESTTEELRARLKAVYGNEFKHQGFYFYGVNLENLSKQLLRFLEIEQEKQLIEARKKALEKAVLIVEDAYNLTGVIMSAKKNPPYIHASSFGHSTDMVSRIKDIDKMIYAEPVEEVKVVTRKFVTKKVKQNFKHVHKHHSKKI